MFGIRAAAEAVEMKPQAGGASLPAQGVKSLIARVPQGNGFSGELLYITDQLSPLVDVDALFV